MIQAVFRMVFSEMEPGIFGRTVIIGTIFIFAESGRTPGTLFHQLAGSERFAMTVQKEHIAQGTFAGDRSVSSLPGKTFVTRTVTERKLRAERETEAAGMGVVGNQMGFIRQFDLAAFEHTVAVTVRSVWSAAAGTHNIGITGVMRIAEFHIGCHITGFVTTDGTAFAGADKYGGCSAFFIFETDAVRRVVSGRCQNGVPHSFGRSRTATGADPVIVVIGVHMGGFADLVEVRHTASS